MKNYLLKKIDHRFWFPLTLITYSLKSFFPASKIHNKTLIVRPGGLGDLVLVTLALSKLNYNYRDFVFLIEKRNLVWAQELELDYLLYDSINFWFKRKTFKSIICTEQMYGLAMLASVYSSESNSYITCFSTNRGYRFGNNICLYNENDTHELLSFKNIIATHFKNDNQINQKSIIGTSFDVMNRNENLVLIGVSGRNDDSRKLDVDVFVDFIKSRMSEDGENVLVSSLNDLDYASSVAKALNIKIETNFSNIVKLIKSCKYLITIDSGLVHIASYFDTPVISIFTSGRPYKWAPTALGSEIWSKDFICQPCNLFGVVPKCNYDFRCHKSSNEFKLVSKFI
jgi:ADP-heptose:LPS heptosyltransferase